MSYFKLNSKGQTLLTVIVAMTIVLAIGVGVSLRLLSSSQRVSSTDTAARVLAAAEGGAEQFLIKPFTELATLESVCQGDIQNPAPECVVDYPGSSSDNIDSIAVVKVSTYGEDNAVEIKIPKDQTAEFNLDGLSGGDASLCWADTSLLSYTIYRNNAFEPYFNGVVNCNGCSHSTLNVNNAATANASGCFTVPLGTNPLGLRITSYGASSRITATLSGGRDFPVQGYEILSTGMLTVPGSQEQAVRTVKVRVSYPFLPGLFDHALYSNDGVIR